MDPDATLFYQSSFNLSTLRAIFAYACVTTSCTCTVFRGKANHVWLPGNFCSLKAANPLLF